MRRTAWLGVGLPIAMWAAVAALTVRSFVRVDMVEHFRPGPTVGLTLGRSRVRAVVGRGAVYLMRMDEREVAPSGAERVRLAPGYVFSPFWSHDVFPADWVAPVAHSWGGFGYERWSILNTTGWSTPRSEGVRFPLWPALVILAVPAVARLLAARARRRRPGTCPGCGYDLRASPCGCPECGDGRPVADPPPGRA